LLVDTLINIPIKESNRRRKTAALRKKNITIVRFITRTHVMQQNA